MFISIIPLLIILAVVTGMSIGLANLARDQRGVAWWCMLIGCLLCIACPILLATGIWKMELHYRDNHYRNMGAGALTHYKSAAIYYGCGNLAGFYGLLLFAIGFVRHSLELRRRLARGRGLNQDLFEMDEVIAGLKRGGMAEAAAAPAPPSDAGSESPPKLAPAAIRLLVIMVPVVAIWAGYVGRDPIVTDDGAAAWITVWLVVLTTVLAGILVGLRELMRGYQGEAANTRDGHDRGKAAEVLMICGVIAVGPAFNALFRAVIKGSIQVPSDSGIVVTVLLPLLGLILFASGFALHGLKVARQRERLSEMEQLKAAMEEEIARLKEAR